MKLSEELCVLLRVSTCTMVSKKTELKRSCEVLEIGSSEKCLETLKEYAKHSNAKIVNQNAIVTTYKLTTSIHVKDVYTIRYRNDDNLSLKFLDLK